MRTIMGMATRTITSTDHDHDHDHDHGHEHGHHAHSPLKFLVNLICPGMVLLSFIFSAGAVWQLSQQAHRVHQVIQFTWLAGLPFHMANGQLATFTLDWGFLLDPLSSVMILVVTGIGFLIHVYSTGYMAHDNGYYRFFGYLNLFVFFMLMLVLANNYALLFVGWEGVGLCSYLLIGFYFHKKSAGDAGKKAFIVNRVGDAGFILGMLLLLSTVGTVRFTDVNAVLRSGDFHAGNGRLRRAEHHRAAACSSAPPANRRSSRCTSGCRTRWKAPRRFRADPRRHHGDGGRLHGGALVGAVPADAAAPPPSWPSIGAFTAILAATIALVQNDIKRVLAYSTVSQLGYMFLALGVGAYWVAVFHLFTHAFFKALLFLGSGSVIHAMGGEQDMRRMGGLKDKIPDHALDHVDRLRGDRRHSRAWPASSPRTRFCGRPTARRKGSKVLWVVGLTTAGMTAFYMWRLMYMTFYGKSRVAPEVAAHIHESPASMTVPLTVLAVGSVFAGWLGVPKLWTTFGENFRGFEHWLEPVFASAAVEAAKEGAASASIEWMLMGTSVGIAVVGILIARYFYHHQAGDSGAHRRQVPALPRTALQQVVRGRDLRFPLRQRPVQRRRPAAGRVRPQRGGWRRERRGLAHALRGDGLDLVGYLGHRWRGALQLVLREDALLSGVHPADRARAGLRLLRGDRGPGVLRILHGAVNIWTSTY